jgi:hypothetical protein
MTDDFTQDAEFLFTYITASLYNIDNWYTSCPQFSTTI